MMGERQVQQDALFYEFSLERHVPEKHLLRAVDRFVDLSGVRGHLVPFYSETGRPSIDPELLIRMLIVGYCFGIRSERRLCEEVHLNLGYRWFCRLGLDGDVPDHSIFSKTRHGRFRDADLLRRIVRDGGSALHGRELGRWRGLCCRCQSDRGGRSPPARCRDARSTRPQGQADGHLVSRHPGRCRLWGCHPGRAEIHLADRSSGALDRLLGWPGGLRLLH